MPRTIITVMVSLIFTVIPAAAGIAHAAKLPAGARGYVLGRLAAHDLVLMGTTHRQPAILGQMAALLPYLHEAGVTHLALEIASDQQIHLDRYLATGRDLKRIRLHRAIACPAYRNLLRSIRQLPAEQRPAIMAVDLPAERYGMGMDRDQWMAEGLRETFTHRTDAKVLMLVGSLHVLRKLEWLPHIKSGHRSIQTRLRAWRPDLRMFAIINIAGTTANGDDFSRALAGPADPVAVDLDERFDGWTLGLTRVIAIAPAQPRELADGVIVYNQ